MTTAMWQQPKLDKAISLESDALDAMAIHAAIELIGERSPIRGSPGLR